MTREEIDPERISGATVVVVDVFMATTTLLTILENGARGVYPVESLEEGEAVSERLGRESLLRGGEQRARNIEDYDHGPFPDEYAPDVVRDKDVVFVTTNGTRAIADASPAERVLAGCLRNAPAVARHLEESGAEDVWLVCAGAAGRFSTEDFVGVATILSFMDTQGSKLNDAAWIAQDFVRRHEGETRSVLKEARVGRWLFEHDRVDVFDWATDIGASDHVPEVIEGRLHNAGGRVVDEEGE